MSDWFCLIYTNTKMWRRLKYKSWPKQVFWTIQEDSKPILLQKYTAELAVNNMYSERYLVRKLYFFYIFNHFPDKYLSNRNMFISKENLQRLPSVIPIISMVLLPLTLLVMFFCSLRPFSMYISMFLTWWSYKGIILTCNVRIIHIQI